MNQIAYEFAKEVEEQWHKGKPYWVAVASVLNAHGLEVYDAEQLFAQINAEGTN